MRTPVLLLVYNRPELTLRVLQRLMECGVTTVFISGDGAKNSTDLAKTNEVRACVERFSSIVAAERYADRNLGCKKAVIAGLDWFFGQVDEGIILEDDCLPSPHFFPFMHSLLDRYRDEAKVSMISGNNPLGSWYSEGDHFFSRIGHIWGWATWKDRWQQFDPELPALQQFILNHGFERAFGPTRFAENRKQLTLRSVRGEIDTWDYQWMAHLLLTNGLAAIPSGNLVENLGFGTSGTNTHEKPIWIKNEITSTPLKICDRAICIDREYEMNFELAKRANRSSEQSSQWFVELGRNETRKLKILTINSTDIGGGAEKLALMLHCQLMERGHEAHFLVKTKKTDLASVHQISTDWKQQIAELDPDVIHVHNLHDSSIELAALAELSERIPVLWTLHDTWLISGSNEHAFQPYPTQLNLLDLRKWKREFEVRRTSIAKGNFRFTAPSQWMREMFFNAHRIVPFHVPNAVEKVEAKEAEYPSERFILFVANRPLTNPYKDFETLKKGWIRANEKPGTDGFDLVCLGGRPLTETHAGRTLFVLDRKTPEEVRAFMERSLLVVQVSKQDNAPLAVLEAHAAGKRVVASLDGGIPELMDETEMGWLHEIQNENDLAEKLTMAIRSLNGVRTTAHPSFRSVLENYLGHYHQLTDD